MSKHRKAAKAAKLNKDKMKCNSPRETPGHATKSHVVKACEGGKEKILRFGQQGVKGAGKNPKTEKEKTRKRLYYARHNAQDKNPSKMSARYWSHKVKWMILSGMIIGDAILQCFPNTGTMLT